MGHHVHQHRTLVALVVLEADWVQDADHRSKGFDAVEDALEMAEVGALQLVCLQSYATLLQLQ